MQLSFHESFNCVSLVDHKNKVRDTFDVKTIVTTTRVTSLRLSSCLSFHKNQNQKSNFRQVI